MVLQHCSYVHTYLSENNHRGHNKITDLSRGLKTYFSNKCTIKKRNF